MASRKSFKNGSEIFKTQLKDLPKEPLSNDELFNLFDPFFEQIEKNKIDDNKISLIERAKKYQHDFKTIAYGYANTYMSILAYKIDKQKFKQILDKKSTS
jgi:hypothetical protein